ncbi:MAG: 3-phosphoserine/phosphohydroxythreonine transaminase, partial [Gemmataceae bacterium]
MLPLNFLPPGGSADYVLTGVWAEKAVEEAKIVGSARVVASSEKDGFRSIPRVEPGNLDKNAAYVHLTSNETIQGIQWKEFPDTSGIPLVADMSSDILSQPFDASRFSLIYAGAQKNLGPSGVTAVVIKEAWLQTANKNVPTMLRYSTHVKNNSLYNTPPTFGVYVLNLVLSWIEKQGGLAGIGQRNAQKAGVLYQAIDESQGFYRGHADVGSRSHMNVTFRLGTEALEKKFATEALSAGMIGLPGHRLVGGLRASIYNAVPLEACTALAQFMKEFARKNG